MKNADKNINNKDNLIPGYNKNSNSFSVLGLTAINGINFKKASELHVKLNINNIEDLYKACVLRSKNNKKLFCDRNNFVDNYSSINVKTRN